MNSKQQNAIDLAREGHNFVVLGAAGTGKSFLMKSIAAKLREDGKQVRITCSTGIACTVYDDACTLHKFAGISDGRHGPNEIADVIKNNRNYESVLENIWKTDTVIVDECSMISQHVFESMKNEFKIKDESLPFGGMQIILCGDFLQLPPVANISYGDDGKFCFESNEFNACFPHKVILTEPIRQCDPVFVQVITDVYRGNISAETEDYLLKLNRPMPNRPNVKLFARNDYVDDYNRKCLLQFNGDVYEFVSEDSGQTTTLHQMNAPHKLWLKTGAPVILLRNLTDKLVNGLQGVVEDIQEGCDPLVFFPSLGMTKTIPKVKFTVYSPKLNTDIAVREQYPLKLAFGLTIHKAQGLTLDRAEVDCRDMFRAGQLGVAISRVRTSADLRILNYHPRYIIAPPKCVTDFMDQASKATSPDLDCCRKRRGADGHSTVEPTTGTCTLPADDSSNDIEDVNEEGFDEELDDEFDVLLHQITADEATSL